MKRITFLKTVALAAWSTVALSFPFELPIKPAPKPEPPKPEPPKPKPEPPKPKPAPKKKKARPIIKFFTATWCGPCQRLKATLKSKNLMDRVEIADCTSGSDYSRYSNKYGFRGVPTLIVLVDDKEIARGNSTTAESLIRKYTDD